MLLIPLREVVEQDVRWAEVCVVNQEAAHQMNWELLAQWCWDREIYLSMSVHKRPLTLKKDEEEVI